MRSQTKNPEKSSPRINTNTTNYTNQTELISPLEGVWGRILTFFHSAKADPT